MKHVILCLGFIITHSHAFRLPGENQFRYNVSNTDSLPTVLTENRADLVGSKLKNEAILRFAQLQLPETKQEWGRL